MDATTAALISSTVAGIIMAIIRAIIIVKSGVPS